MSKVLASVKRKAEKWNSFVNFVYSRRQKSIYTCNFVYNLFRQRRFGPEKQSERKKERIRQREREREKDTKKKDKREREIKREEKRKKTAG